MAQESLETLSINTIRMLSVDAVQKANSGHPGAPMGLAPAAYVLWTRFLKHNPHNPSWPDRDRFVLSAGHGSMLLYSMLHLTGYDLPLDQIKQFRQWGSRTPGHPERGHTPGVETTTGPLGQGFRQRRRHGDRRSPFGGALQSSRFRCHQSLYLCDRQRRRLDGRRGRGSGESRRPSETGQVDLSLRQQSDFACRRCRSQLHGRLREAVRGLRLAHQYPSRTATTSERSSAPSRAARAETSRPSLILLRTHIGYRFAGKARHLRSARLAARRSGSQTDQRKTRLALRADVLYTG